MLTPEKMTLLKISIHTSQVPALLNFIPEHKMHIQAFKEEKETGHRHLRRERLLEDESEVMEQKLNEIEEFLIYYFQKMEINPEKVPIPAAADRVILNVSSVKDAVTKLHDLADHEIRRMKGYINDKEKYLKDIAEYKILKELFKWLEKYKPTSIVFEWFEQLAFRIGYIYHDDLDELIVSLEHEQIPMVFEFKELNSETAAFFMIYHQIQEEQISDICRNAIQIVDYQKYFDENGVKLAYITEQIEFCKQRIDNAQEYIDSQDIDMIKFRGYIEILKNCRKYNSLEKQFRESFRGDIVRLEAFIPVKDQESILEELDEKFHTHIRIHAHQLLKEAKEVQNNSTDLRTEEEEFDYGQDGEDAPVNNIPTMVNIPKLFKPFRILTDLYGVTNYNEIDPTPFVALTYPILFGLMFGDVGHGLILILLGLLMIFLKRSNKETKAYDAGFLLIWLGAGAVLGGLLYGEIFGSGEVFPALFASPLHDVTTEIKGALFVGVAHLTLGFSIKFINDIKNKKVYLAFADPFWKIMILWGGAYVIFVHSFRLDEWFSPDEIIPYPVLLAVIPAIPLLLGKSIGKIIGISYLQHESVGGLIGEQTIEVGETYLNILSNVASYTRLLALAMAHMGLMLVVTELVNLISSTIGVILVLVIGNLFVIVMESVLAAIHALRLTFYEFFGKFYLADGIPYETTKIDSEYSVIEFKQS